MKVTLDNDYSACSFKIEFESEGNYKAELIDTQENSHDFTVIDGKTMTCDLDKTKKGEYTVNIISASEDDIGKVTLSVNSQKTSTTDIVDNNIKIGRDISGLKMYLKDSSLIVTWTDETCGAVNVKVVNPDTGETVKNEKVTTKYFECNLNDDIQKISVSVVPAASSSITGAELTFNIDAFYNPDVTIKFPDKTKVNKDEITIHVALGNTYSIYAEDNDECVLTTDMMIEGDYDLKIPLKYDGSNKLKVYVVDADGNISTTERYYLVLDNSKTISKADYEQAEKDLASLDYLSKSEVKYADLGLGLQEDSKTGEVIGSSVFNVALQGINFLGYGVDADGDPKNIVSIISRMGQILLNCDATTGAFAEGERDEFQRLADKFEASAALLQDKHIELDTQADFLKSNQTQLESMAYTLEQQFLGIEDVDPAEAISQLSWAKYCYNTALKVGNSILSQSLMDYINA